MASDRDGNRRFPEWDERGAAFAAMLPYPPSVNTYWRHVGRKVLISKAGREYREDVENRLRHVGKGWLKGPLVVYVKLFPPDRRRRDVDNTMKGLLDALGKVGVYEDDSQIVELRIRRSHVVTGGQALVTIWTEGEVCP